MSNSPQNNEQSESEEKQDQLNQIDEVDLGDKEKFGGQAVVGREDEHHKLPEEITDPEMLAKIEFQSMHSRI